MYQFYTLSAIYYVFRKIDIQRGIFVSDEDKI